MSASMAAADNRFQSVTPAALSKTEKSAVVTLALAVLKQRWRRGRVFTSPGDIEGFPRLKLAGRRNEVFGILYLDTRHRLIELDELFQGTVDGAVVYPRVVVQRSLEKNAAAAVIFHNHPARGSPSRARPTATSPRNSPRPWRSSTCDCSIISWSPTAGRFPWPSAAGCERCPSLDTLAEPAPAPGSFSPPSAG